MATRKGGDRVKKRRGMAQPDEKATRIAEDYAHYEATSPMRPEVGTQAQFRKKKPPRTYRYDSSLSPALDWDGQNSSREFGEWLLCQIEDAAALPAPHAFDTCGSSRPPTAPYARPSATCGTPSST